MKTYIILVKFGIVEGRRFDEHSTTSYSVPAEGEIDAKGRLDLYLDIEFTNKSVVWQFDSIEEQTEIMLL